MLKDNSPIEYALSKEIEKLKLEFKDKNAQCFHKDETISVLKNSITELEFDNRSLVEQMNQMALKPNQEVIEWHGYPEEKPEPSRCCIVECKNFCYHIAHHSEIDGWLDSVTFDVLSEVKAWAYLPKGVTNE